MAENQPTPTLDSRSGFNSHTKTFHSLRPRVTLPPLTQPLSVAKYVFHLLHSSAATSPSPTTPFLIDSTSGHVITFPEFVRQTNSLAFSLQTSFPSLSKNDVALVLSPPTLDLPVLYFSLLSLGVTVCPVNPLATPSELTHMIKLAKPVIAFTISPLSPKIPNLSTVLLDSPEFKSMTSLSTNPTRISVQQSDRAAILFSSGTTGQVKGVDLTHRNFIALLTGFYYIRTEADVAEETPRAVTLFTLPLFHVFGFSMMLRAAAVGEMLVVMTARVDFEGILKAVEKYKVSHVPVSPPLVVGLAKSPVVAKYDLSSLRVIGCGGAPLGKEVVEAFAVRFPGVETNQGYGLTETVGAATRMLEPEELSHYGSVGKLSENLEAKIVDPNTGESLPPNQRGELWLRGPTVMRGYVGDDEATAAALDQDGWLKTGDLCYFDSDGFIYVVDRLKELIKYKAYQVPPAELEQLLQGHPEIADAAVVPYPDEEAGQIPMAFIVRKPQSNITAAQVMDFIAKLVSPYKKIRRVAFINAIPKSPAGKILRRELANDAISGVSSKL